MNRILAADTTTKFNKAYEYSGYALAGAVPVAAFTSKGSAIQKTCDFVLSVAIPVHMHLTTNAVVTDYIPKGYRPPVRAAVLAASAVTYLGIMKINLGGPGLTETVKLLWRKQAPAAAQPPAAPATSAGGKK